MSASKSVVSLDRGDVTRFSGPAELADRAKRLERRAQREHAARHEAERLLESKSLELFDANQRLIRLNQDLEQRVEARTKQLDDARKAALKLSATDHLTGIANRQHYSEHLRSTFPRRGANGGALGLLLVDLDGFKMINDSYGHRHGDKLLIELADRLRSSTERRDLVARVGGDEFAVVIEGEDSVSIFEAANRVRTVFEKPITIHGVTIRVRGSLGLAIYPDHCNNSIDLQRFADLALYRSKDAGDGEIVAFERAFLDAYEYRQRMEDEFRKALEVGNIELSYQPIVCLQTGRITKVEALARWTDSNGVEVSPAYFIPLAEQCGIIRWVGRSLLEKALSETREWLADGLINRVSFNVAPEELLDEGFCGAILGAIRKAGVEPCHLLLEITEGAAIRNLTVVGEVMRHLSEKGVTFALDDFGCGYTDLSTLRKLPIDVLKIDRSLLVDAEADHAARVILRSVVTLCRSLGIRSVCEGAETAAQLAILRKIKCDSVQGFALGRPGRPMEIGARLKAATDR